MPPKKVMTVPARAVLVVVPVPAIATPVTLGLEIGAAGLDPAVLPIHAPTPVPAIPAPGPLPAVLAIAAAADTSALVNNVELNDIEKQVLTELVDNAPTEPDALSPEKECDPSPAKKRKKVVGNSSSGFSPSGTSAYNSKSYSRWMNIFVRSPSNPIVDLSCTFYMVS
jgi:hypothetical protein